MKYTLSTGGHKATIVANTPTEAVDKWLTGPDAPETIAMLIMIRPEGCTDDEVLYTSGEHACKRLGLIEA